MFLHVILTFLLHFYLFYIHTVCYITHMLNFVCAMKKNTESSTIFLVFTENYSIQLILLYCIFPYCSTLNTFRLEQ